MALGNGDTSRSTFCKEWSVLEILIGSKNDISLHSYCTDFLSLIFKLFLMTIRVGSIKKLETPQQLSVRSILLTREKILQGQFLAFVKALFSLSCHISFRLSDISLMLK